MRAKGVTLEAYKPVQADHSADAIEAEAADKPQHKQTIIEETKADTTNVTTAPSTSPSPAALPIAPLTPSHSTRGANGEIQIADRSTVTSPLTSPRSASTSTTDHPRNVRLLHFQRLLNDETLDLSALRALAWNGVPAECRADVWRLLLGYLPLSKTRRDSMLDKRRQEYITFLRQHYLPLAAAPPTASLDTETLNQIQQDVPRTSPAYPFFKRPSIQKSLERVLFIFAVRHPASGYVQGMNDLVTPFYAVMLDAAVAGGGEMVMSGGAVEEEGGGGVSESVMLAVEADCYWCLSSLLDSVQDHYTFAQPGIQRCVYRLSSLVQSLHPALYAHLDKEGVSFLHFAFRWMNCLLMREMSLPCTIRLFDTYIAASSDTSMQSFATFHVFVCTAFLLQWAGELVAFDFQELILFLQKPPTERWGVRDVEGLIAQAYVYQSQSEPG